MTDIPILIFQLVVLVFSVMVHEVSHGLIAYKLGDMTARDEGRLTLNPLKHIDPLGSIFLPLILFLSGSPVMFGWAKPVPYNPFNLKNPKRGGALIGLAGPLSNLTLALIFGIIIRLLAPFVFFTTSGHFLILLLNIVVIINVLLAVFNLVPIPPLDGSKLLFAFLPNRYAHIQGFLEQYGVLLLLFLIFYGIRYISPIVDVVYSVIVGVWGI